MKSGSAAKEVMRVSLDAKQVREAIEQYVARRTFGDYSFAAGYDGKAVDVRVLEKRMRVRKAKGTKLSPVEAAMMETDKAAA